MLVPGVEPLNPQPPGFVQPRVAVVTVSGDSVGSGVFVVTLYRHPGGDGSPQVVQKFRVRCAGEPDPSAPTPCETPVTQQHSKTVGVNGGPPLPKVGGFRVDDPPLGGVPLPLQVCPQFLGGECAGYGLLALKGFHSPQVVCVGLDHAAPSKVDPVHGAFPLRVHSGHLGDASRRDHHRVPHAHVPHTLEPRGGEDL